MYLYYVFCIIAGDQHRSHQRISSIMYRSHISVYRFSIPAFAKYFTSLLYADYSNNNFHLNRYPQSIYISCDQGALSITTLRQLLQTTLGEGISTCPFAMTSETEFQWICCIRNLDGEFCWVFLQGDVGFEGFPSCMLEGIGVSTPTGSIYQHVVEFYDKCR